MNHPIFRQANERRDRPGGESGADRQAMSESGPAPDPPAAQARPARTLTLRAYLVAMTLAVLLPMGLLGSIAIREAVSQYQHAYQERLLATVRLLSLSLDSDIQTRKTAIMAIATSPLLDQPPPVQALRRFGRRRGWLLLIQPALGLAALLLAVADPLAAPAAAFAAAAGVALLSATQDIAVDAWRIEIFPERRQGVALAAYVWGYRVALLVSMSGVVAASASLGWHAPLMGVAGLIAAGTLVTLAAAPEEAGEARAAGGLRYAVIDSLRLFLMRPSALLVLAFVALFKLGEAMAGIMTAPFYRHLAFDKDAIAKTGPFSLCATLAGITLGGWLVARIGVGRALLWTGTAQTAAMGMYVLLSLSPGRQVRRLRWFGCSRPSSSTTRRSRARR